MTGWFQHCILTMSHRNGIACGQHLAKGVVALHLSQSNEQDQCAELFAEGCSLLFENQMKKDTMQQERLAVHPLLEDPPRSCSSPCYRSLMQCYITLEGADVIQLLISGTFIEATSKFVHQIHAFGTTLGIHDPILQKLSASCACSLDCASSTWR